MSWSTYDAERLGVGCWVGTSKPVIELTWTRVFRRLIRWGISR
jgi:hypothetical protein